MALAFKEWTGLGGQKLCRLCLVTCPGASVLGTSASSLSLCPLPPPASSLSPALTQYRAGKGSQRHCHLTLTRQAAASRDPLGKQASWLGIRTWTRNSGTCLTLQCGDVQLILPSPRWKLRSFNGITTVNFPLAHKGRKSSPYRHTWQLLSCVLPYLASK